MTECKRCGKCCKFVAIPIGIDDIHRDDYSSWLAYHDAFLEDYAGLTWVVIPSNCTFLEANRCQIYQTRPILCQFYPRPSAWVPPGCAWDKRP